MGFDAGAFADLFAGADAASTVGAGIDLGEAGAAAETGGEVVAGSAAGDATASGLGAQTFSDAGYEAAQAAAGNTALAEGSASAVSNGLTASEVLSDVNTGINGYNAINDARNGNYLGAASSAFGATGGFSNISGSPDASIGGMSSGGGAGGGFGGGGGAFSGADYGNGEGFDFSDDPVSNGGLTSEDQALTPGPGGATPSTNATNDPQIAAQQVANTQGIGNAQGLQSGANSATSGNDSVMNALKSLGAFGKNVAPIAGLGLAALQGHKTQSAAQSLNGIAQPASNVSNQLLAQFQQGQLNPADAYQIAQTAQQQIAQAKQYYASAGLSNSSMEQEAIANIQNQANAAREAAAQKLLSGGLSAAGVAQGPQLAAVQASVAADQQLQQATSSFMNALAKMNTNSTPAAASTATSTSTDLGS